MPSATVRRAGTVGALTTALTLSLPLTPQATADAGKEDSKRLRFIGVTASDTRSMPTAPGASWVMYQHLYDVKGTFLGDASAQCGAVHADRNLLTAQCTRVLRLKNGELTLHDVITRNGDARITAKTAIAGGTGVYKDAEGEGYLTVETNRTFYDLHVDD